MSSNVKYIVRFVCLAFVLSNNIPILIIVARRLFEHIDETNKRAMLWTITYISFAILQPGYNLLYRFIITENDCFWSDCIDEWLLVFSRIALVYCQTYRVQLTFKGSFLEINKKVMTWTRNIFLIFALLVNFLWIHIFPMYISPTYHKVFGVYCSNGGNDHIVVTFYAVDGLLHIALIAVFVHQLNKIAAKSDTTNAPHYQSLHNTARMSVYCIAISIVTTWTFVVASVLHSFPIPQLRWFFPLDFTINVWCLLRMFGKVRFICFISHHGQSPEVKLTEIFHRPKSTSDAPKKKKNNGKKIIKIKLKLNKNNKPK
eukprot:56405_1